MPTTAATPRCSRLKLPGLLALTETAQASQVVDVLAPQAGEYVVRKIQPSAFFGTGLVGWLAQKRVDTVLVTGCTTSGCVRASVINSMSHNFKTVVVSDCVGDRAHGAARGQSVRHGTEIRGPDDLRRGHRKAAGTFRRRADKGEVRWSIR